ncbi:sororin isoform X1 [Chiloscyllium plagiosum]|uniref:sororin isoform X1 n=1 Tax=Chiloscyllium plagiosum TaxID=36176 RepID=UPI001CB8440A|nr:sororin isoform X1 [Chiloscyllium plagiosum]
MAETRSAPGGSRDSPRNPGFGLPARRKSDRLSATQKDEGSQAPVVKRSIVLKKIEPQKNVLAKSITATPRRSSRVSPKTVKENAGGDWASVADQEAARVSASPPAQDAERGALMSQKVRRSYSRLSPYGVHLPSVGGGASDTSTPNGEVEGAASRRSLFGFGRLLAGDTAPGVSPVKRPLTPEVEKPLLAAGSLAQLDLNIPGVAVAKEKRKKRKVPQIEKSELDEWAAQMNASFEEAERFDLLVE